MVSQTPPCRHCENRSASCHGTCEKYNVWRKWIADANARARMVYSNGMPQKPIKTRKG